MIPLKNKNRPLFFLLVILAGLTTASVQGLERPEAAERKPVILLDEIAHMPSPPGKWNLNSLNPTFVLYKDGLVIFKKGRRSSALFSAQLTTEQMNAWLEGLHVEEFLKLEEDYSTINLFDQPLSTIRYWQDHTMKRVKVYGPIRESAEDRNRAPQTFLRVFDRLISFDHENARLWEPEKLELHVIPYTDARGEPVAWPKGWSDLNDETTKDTTEWIGTGESYSLYLSGDHREELEQLLSGLKEKQAVLMDGRQWYMSPSRYCLPNEEVWKD
jgi:hypothetical protein